MEKLKILQVEVENYKRLGAFMLELDGDNLAIAGSTNQGKTTAISVLWDLLSVASDPIKKGEKKARIKILLGNGVENVVAERIITEKTSKITVHIETVGGTKRKITAKEFKTWFSSLAVNPHRILDMKPTEQIKTLISAAHLPEGFNLGEMDQSIKDAEEDRKTTNSVRNRLLAKLGSDTEPEIVERVDPAELFEEIQAAQNHNDIFDDVTGDQNRFAMEIANHENQIKSLREKKEKGAGWLKQNNRRDTVKLKTPGRTGYPPGRIYGER